MKPSAPALLRRFWRSPVAWLSSSVLLLGVLLVEVNLWSARSFERFDFTAEQRHSLSPKTLGILAQLTDPLDVVALVSSAAPEYPEIRLLLDTFRARSRLFQVRFVDPERQIAQYLKEVGGDRPGDASESIAFVVHRGTKRGVVTAQELAAPAEARSERIEAALARAVSEVSERKDETVCFMRGHGEPGPSEMPRVERRLATLGLTAKESTLDTGDNSTAFLDCSVIAVVAPSSRWPSAHVEKLANHLMSGGRLFLAISPTVSQDGDLENLGLEPLLTALGATFRNEYVLERDPARRLPEGLGEAFFPGTSVHPVTLGLGDGGGARPVAVAAGHYEVVDPSRAKIVLQSSAQSIAIRSLGDAAIPDKKGPFAVGVAFEGQLERGASSPGTRGDLRAVLLSFSTQFEPAQSETFSERGNDLLLENALLWLRGRAELPPTGEKGNGDEASGLVLTEESLTRLGRYVLLEIPAFSLLLGALVLWLRRRKPRGPVSGGEVSP